MKAVFIFVFIFFVATPLFSQELASKKIYDFATILEESKNKELKFVVTNFYTEANNTTVLSFSISTEFPITEEKETWKFGEIREEYAPIINLENFYRSIPKFTNFSPYAKKHLDQLLGKMRILKGYDFCGRPVY